MLVEAQNLVKRYGDFTAVNGISLAVPEGICFGLLGPNGAGKSTTLRMITGFLPPTGGQLRVLGLDPQAQGRALKAQIGVIPQEDNLDEDLCVLDNLLVYASYFGMGRPQAHQRALELLGFMQLEEKTTAPIRALSGGMRRRLMIARGLINQPRLVVLDEPTTGLDPQARHLIWDRLRQLKETGVGLLLCTHYMEEAERLCDELVLLSDGKILTQGTPGQLVARLAGQRAVELPETLEEEWRTLLAGHSQEGLRQQKAHGHLYLYFPHTHHPALLAVQEKWGETALFRQPNLEDVFLLLTGRELVE